MQHEKYFIEIRWVKKMASYYVLMCGIVEYCILKFCSKKSSWRNHYFHVQEYASGDLNHDAAWKCKEITFFLPKKYCDIKHSTLYLSFLIVSNRINLTLESLVLNVPTKFWLFYTFVIISKKQYETGVLWLYFKGLGSLYWVIKFRQNHRQRNNNIWLKLQFSTF